MITREHLERALVDANIRERDLNNQIKDLQHQLAVKDKALELVCKDLCDNDCSLCSYCPHQIKDRCPDECPMGVKLIEDYFIEQAEKVGVDNE